MHLFEKKKMAADLCDTPDIIDVYFVLESQCVDRTITVKMDEYPIEMSWEIKNRDGNILCESPPEGYSWNYANLEIENAPCCLSGDVTYVLTCMDTYGDGWAYGGPQGWIEIAGIRMCDDFDNGLSVDIEFIIPHGKFLFFKGYCMAVQTLIFQKLFLKH